MQETTLFVFNAIGVQSWVGVPFPTQGMVLLSQPVIAAIPASGA